MKPSYLIKDKNKLKEGIKIEDKIHNRPIRIFIVNLLRYGNKEQHQYITGIFSSYKEALKNAKIAMQDRGGKYDAEIMEAYIDEPWDVKTYRVIHYGDEY